MTSVLIVGGGVIGLSAGWRAARLGMTVTVADPEPASGASHASAGMLAPAVEAAYAERELFALAVESAKRWPEFAAEIAEASGQPVGIRYHGTLQIAYDAGDLAELVEKQALREAFGAPAQRLTGREARALEPLLAPGVSGGLFTETDGSVDPRLLTSALMTALARAGGTLVRSRVVRVRLRGGAVAGVSLADGSELDCDWLVMAAGAASAGLAGLPPGAAPPTRPVKGQILRLRANPSAGLITRNVSALVQGFPVYLVPRDSGELVVGATQEELGTDTRVTAGGVWRLLRDAQAVVPSVTELDFAEACAGLRPGTPDNSPVLGPGSVPGLVFATGHYRTGILLSAVTADAITEFLATERIPPLIAPFSADRFTAESAGVS